MNTGGRRRKRPLSDEDSFQSAIDELYLRMQPRRDQVLRPPDPEDLARLRGVRLVFADWLQERGDARAAGQRWLAENGKYPYDWSADRRVELFTTSDWYRGRGAVWAVPDHCHVPEELWRRLPPRRPQTDNWAAYPTRREAEEALIRAVLANQSAATKPRRRRSS
jgi:uncharacterized protein (TIGR02996 family)